MLKPATRRGGLPILALATILLGINASTVSSRDFKLPNLPKVSNNPIATATGVIGSIINSITGPSMEHAGDIGHELIADVDGRLGQRLNETMAGADNISQKRMAQVDDSLERRIVQVDGVIDKTIGRAELAVSRQLSSVDIIVKNNLVLINDAVKAQISTLDSYIESYLNTIQTIITNSLNSVDEITTNKIDQIDQSIENRIIGAEIAATRTTLTAEDAVARIVRGVASVVLLTAIIFLIARTGWNTLQNAATTEGNKRPHPLGDLKRVCLPSILWLVIAGVAGIVTIQVASPLFVPSSKSEIVRRARACEEAYLIAMRQLDLRRANSLVQQLVAFDPPSVRYQALGIKQSLYKEVFALARNKSTPLGMEFLKTQLASYREFLSSNNLYDPDANVIDAFLTWHGNVRQIDAYRAAQLCAASLHAEIGRNQTDLTHSASTSNKPLPTVNEGTNHVWVTPLLLQDLAHTYLEIYLATPLPPDATKKTNAGRSEYSHDVLRTLLATTAESSFSNGSINGLTYIGLYNRSIINVHSVLQDYLAMLEAHALIMSNSSSDSVDTKAQTERAEYADRIVKKWESFDDNLRREPLLYHTAAELKVFQLNDALYTRARWFQSYREKNGNLTTLFDSYGGPSNQVHPVPPTIAESFTASANQRGLLCPPRVIWDQRYLAGAGDNIRVILRKEASENFDKQEKALVDFEDGYLDFLKKNEIGANASSLTIQERSDAIKLLLARASTANLFNMHDVVRGDTSTSLLDYFLAKRVGTSENKSNDALESYITTFREELYNSPHPHPYL